MTDQVTLPDETERINELAGELNREAEDVLEYQVIRWCRDNRPLRSHAFDWMALEREKIE